MSGGVRFLIPWRESQVLCSLFCQYVRELMYASLLQERVGSPFSRLSLNICVSEAASVSVVRVCGTRCVEIGVGREHKGCRSQHVPPSLGLLVIKRPMCVRTLPAIVSGESVHAGVKVVLEVPRARVRCALLPLLSRSDLLTSFLPMRRAVLG